MTPPTTTTAAGPATNGTGTTYAAYARPLWQRLLLNRTAAMVALLVIAYGYADNQVQFFSGPLTNYFLLLDMAPILLMALPMTLVIITGEIDLSVASTLGLSAVVTGLLVQDHGLSVPVAGVVALVIGLAAGLLNGFLVAYVGLPSLAVTIGTLALYRGIAVGLIGTKAVSDLPAHWQTLANKHVGTSSYPVIVIPIAVLAVVFALVLHFTPFGRGVYEIGLNSETAHFSGVDVRRTKLVLFGLSGLVSSFAGVFYLLRFNSANTDTGTGLELQVIAAVLLGGVSIFGGRGDLVGVLAGVLLIGVLQSALRLQQTSSDVIEIVIGVLLVLSVISTQLLDRVRALWIRSRRTQRSAPAPEVGDESSRKVMS
jgi:rhamnose transport system permease protein